MSDMNDLMPSFSCSIPHFVCGEWEMSSPLFNRLCTNGVYWVIPLPFLLVLSKHTALVLTRWKLEEVTLPVLRSYLESPLLLPSVLQWSFGSVRGTIALFVGFPFTVSDPWNARPFLQDVEADHLYHKWNWEHRLMVQPVLQDTLSALSCGFCGSKTFRKVWSMSGSLSLSFLFFLCLRKVKFPGWPGATFCAYIPALWDTCGRWDITLFKSVSDFIKEGNDMVANFPSPAVHVHQNVTIRQSLLAPSVQTHTWCGSFHNLYDGRALHFQKWTCCQEGILRQRCVNKTTHTIRICFHIFVLSYVISIYRFDAQYVAENLSNVNFRPFLTIVSLWITRQGFRISLDPIYCKPSVVFLLDAGVNFILRILFGPFSS